MTDPPFQLDDDTASVSHLASPVALGHRIVPKFRVRAHQTLISTAIVNGMTGRGPRFIAISIGQQFGKSFISTILAPTLWIEWHALGIVPGGLCGLVSAEDSLVLDFSSQSRRLIQHNPDVFVSQVRKDSKAASFWQTESGGGILATGVGGSIVGRPISLLVFDDVIKTPDQANSDKHRDQVWNLWQSVGYGRLQPWTVVLVVMTRWHPDDFIGRLLSDEYPGDPADWHYIRIPAVCDDPETDPLGRELGQALLRPQWDGSQEEANYEMERVKAGISEYYWHTLWQQNPHDPEGTIFYERCWRYYSTEPKADYPLPAKFDQVYMSWDMAFKATSDTDFVVGQAWGGIGADRYLLAQVRGRWSFTETCARVKSFANVIREKYPNATGILVEDKANGPAVIDQLRSSVGGLIEFDVSDHGSKDARAHACQPLLLGGNLYIPSEKEAPWIKDYRTELAQFPKGKNDDQVDATTQALLYMRNTQVGPVSIITGSTTPLPRNAPSSLRPASPTRLILPARPPMR